MEDEALEKLRILVQLLDDDPDYWVDERPYWQVANGLAVTAGDLRTWMLAIDGEVPDES